MRHVARMAARVGAICAGMAMVAMASAGCAKPKAVAATGPIFANDLNFLRKYTPNLVLLSDHTGQGQVIVSPALQGRVVTSTDDGTFGLSYGWVNRKLIASQKLVPHCNAFGGEDRFWLGPEGGQFGLFFKKGAPFDLAHWYTPAGVDSEPWQLVTTPQQLLTDKTQVTLRKTLQVTNASGTQFNVQVDREVRLVNRDELARDLHCKIGPQVHAVAYESINKLTNTGKVPWTKKTGLLSIWILGQYNASPRSTVVIPFVPGPASKLGPIVHDAYFGKVPPSRLVIRGNTIFFKADANYRSKIGIPPLRSKAVLGSYDAAHGALTIVQLNQPKGVTDYVNSMWHIQKHPFAGDVINSYNDGVNSTGSQMGKFYELETSSPAAALAPNASITHIRRTIHLQGPRAQLDAIARAVLGVSLNQIEQVFPPPKPKK